MQLLFAARLPYVSTLLLTSCLSLFRERKCKNNAYTAFHQQKNSKIGQLMLVFLIFAPTSRLFPRENPLAGTF